MDEVHDVSSLRRWRLPVDQTGLGGRRRVPQERAGREAHPPRSFLDRGQMCAIGALGSLGRQRRARLHVEHMDSLERPGGSRLEPQMDSSPGLSERQGGLDGSA